MDMEGRKEICASAPGKIIFHGEHAVVYGKPAVAASLGMRTKVKLVGVPDKEGCISFHSKDIGVERRFESDLRADIYEICQENHCRHSDQPNRKLVEAIVDEVSESRLPFDDKDTLAIVTLVYFILALEININTADNAYEPRK